MTLAELSYRMACEPDLLKALLAEPKNALVSAKIHLAGHVRCPGPGIFGGVYADRIEPGRDLR